MKNLFCKRLAACLCIKQPPSPALEPPLIRRRNRDAADVDGRVSDFVDDDDVRSSNYTTDNESIQKLLKRLCDLLETQDQKEKERCYEDDKENEMRKDWMLAAAILDRISAIAFVVIFVGGTVSFILCFCGHCLR